MNKKKEWVYGQDMFEALKRLNRNVKRRTGNMSKGSCERGRGSTLKAIKNNDGIRSTDLAKLLDIRPPSLTEKLRKLEADGLIIRFRDRHDARIIRIYITALGKKALLEKDESLIQLRKDFSEALDMEEQNLFCEFCHRISDLLEYKCRRDMELANEKMIKLAKQSEVYIGDENAYLKNNQNIG